MTTLYVVNKITAELTGVVHGETEKDATAAAILLMSRHTPNLNEARQQFRLTRHRPNPKEVTCTRRQHPVMPWGKYEGCRFDCIPWQYLDRCLSSDLIENDPKLYNAIVAYLETIPEWQDQQYAEQNFHADYNHVRDFDPSLARGK